jgi:hypothetical protein
MYDYGRLWSVAMERYQGCKLFVKSKGIIQKQTQLANGIVSNTAGGARQRDNAYCVHR